jgi:hypothetical protein
LEQEVLMDLTVMEEVQMELIQFFQQSHLRVVEVVAHLQLVLVLVLLEVQVVEVDLLVDLMDLVVMLVEQEIHHLQVLLKEMLVLKEELNLMVVVLLLEVVEELRLLERLEWLQDLHLLPIWEDVVEQEHQMILQDQQLLMLVVEVV